MPPHIPKPSLRRGQSTPSARGRRLQLLVGLVIVAVLGLGSFLVATAGHAAPDKSSHDTIPHVVDNEPHQKGEAPVRRDEGTTKADVRHSPPSMMKKEAPVHVAVDGDVKEKEGANVGTEQQVRRYEVDFDSECKTPLTDAEAPSAHKDAATAPAPQTIAEHSVRVTQLSSRATLLTPHHHETAWLPPDGDVWDATWPSWRLPVSGVKAHGPQQDRGDAKTGWPAEASVEWDLRRAMRQAATAESREEETEPLPNGTPRAKPSLASLPVKVDCHAQPHPSVKGKMGAHQPSGPTVSMTYGAGNPLLYGNPGGPDVPTERTSTDGSRVEVTFVRGSGNEDLFAAREGKKVHARDDATAYDVIVHFPSAMDLLGLATRGDGPVLPDGREIEMMNLDINNDQLHADISLYGAVPLVYATDRRHRSGNCMGIFVHNTAPMVVAVKRDFGETALVFKTSAGGVRVAMYHGPTPRDVLRQHLALTGRPHLPPYFGLGYHQSRWSYRDTADVTYVSKGFDDGNIPCDTIWLDIDHTNGRRYFTWDRRKFPTPDVLQRSMWADSGRRMVTITDPHIARDHGYHVFAEADKQRFFIETQGGGGAYVGHCWPGSSSWVDYLDPKAREWYATLFSSDRYAGATEFLYSWIDMNEPSVFSGHRGTMPLDTVHRSAASRVFEAEAGHTEGGGHGLRWKHGKAGEAPTASRPEVVSHRHVHNVYGHYHSMATFAGHVRKFKGLAPTADGGVATSSKTTTGGRPFILTRSFYAGSQRYAAVWTGDNRAEWAYLAASVGQVLEMSLSGITHVGADVGGFFGNPPPDMLRRWYQLGAIYPFFRGHSHEQAQRREPFALPTEATTHHVAAAIRWRYQILPQLYTAFAEATADLSSVLRMIMIERPEEQPAYAVTDTFFVGPALLARPIVRPQTNTIDVYVPDRPAVVARRLAAIRQFNIARGVAKHPGGENEELPLAHWHSLCSRAALVRPSTNADPTFSGGHDAKHRVAWQEPDECSGPLFLAAGHIAVTKHMPLGTKVHSTEDSRLLHNELHIALEADGTAFGDVYLDDGLTFDHMAPTSPESPPPASDHPNAAERAVLEARAAGKAVEINSNGDVVFADGPEKGAPLHTAPGQRPVGSSCWVRFTFRDNVLCAAPKPGTVCTYHNKIEGHAAAGVAPSSPEDPAKLSPTDRRKASLNRDGDIALLSFYTAGTDQRFIAGGMAMREAARKQKANAEEPAAGGDGDAPAASPAIHAAAAAFHGEPTVTGIKRGTLGFGQAAAVPKAGSGHAVVEKAEIAAASMQRAGDFFEVRGVNLPLTPSRASTEGLDVAKELPGGAPAGAFWCVEIGTTEKP